MNKLSVFAATFLALSGCSSTDNGSSKAGGTGGAHSSGSGGSPSGNTGGATASKSGGAPGVGGSQTGAGGSASGGKGSAVGGASNNAAVGGTSAGGTSAAGGRVGTGGTSASGTGGATAGDLTLAAGLNGRLEVPCIGVHAGELCSSVMSKALPAVIFGGDPQITYKVTLHVRGLTEGRTFNDLQGQPVPAPGNLPFMQDSSQATPLDDSHAVYWLDVGEPAKKYYFNVFDGREDHAVYALDYMADVLVKGGASVTLHFEDGNTEQSANFNNQVVPNVPPAPLPFDGEFLQIDVVSVTVVN